MKIQYASDLHLEFRENSKYLKRNPIIPVGDILLLAGDIGYLEDYSYSTHEFWDWASDNFRQTLIIPGNHEFYKSCDVGTIKNGCIAEIRPNVKCYYDTIVTIDDIDLFLCTLWSKIQPENAFATQKSVSDFFYISYNGRLITPYVFNEAHQKSVKFLEKAVQTSKQSKKIVVSHHVPTFLCMADEFKNSRINGDFVAELHDFIFDSNINYWIYGHSHRNIPEININCTKMLCNQLGYIQCKEHLTFNPKAFFEIE